MKESEQKYDKLPSNESLATKSEDGEGVDLFELEQQNRLLKQTRRLNQLLLANCCIFIISLLILGAAFVRGKASTLDFVSRYSSYSPAHGAVSYVSGTFNASQGEDSGYVGTSPQTEEMWNMITSDIGDQMITAEEMKMIDKPLTSIKAKDPKSGEEGYRIGIEVFHQLHCLNMLRKSTYPEVFNGTGDFAEGPGKVRAHLDHCLEMLRMNIMCQVDIGVITFHELPDKPGDPWPDFSSKHVCRDFDAVRDWAVENTVANDDIF